MAASHLIPWHRRLMSMGAAASLAVMACVAWLPARAQDYPQKPVTIVAPSTPGGGFDLMGRVMGEGLTKRLGKSFVVENRSGSGTVIGTQYAAHAAADGYTLVVGGVSNMVFNAGLYKSLPYDPVEDFTPIGIVATYPYVLIVRADLPARNYAELLQTIKAHPDELTIGSGGPGTGSFILAEAFRKATDAKVRLIPYRGAQGVYMDLLSGRVDMFIDVLPTLAPHLEEKRVRAMFITSAQRVATAPDVPTVKELGVPALETGSWFGLFAPSKTPAPIVTRLRDALMATMKDEALRARLQSKGVELLDLSLPETNALVQSDYKHWTAFIKQAGIVPD